MSTIFGGTGYTNWGTFGAGVVAGDFFYTLGWGTMGYPNNFTSTMAIDISQPWTNQTVQLVAALGGPFTTLNQPSLPSLFYCPQKDLIYLWGNAASDYQENGVSTETPIKILMKFSPDGKGAGSWSKLQSTSPSKFVGQLFPWSSTWTTSETELFSLGGYKVGSVDYLVGGFTTYNALENSWTNTSSTIVTPSGYALDGLSIFVPTFGANGIVVVTGLVQRKNQLDILYDSNEVGDFSNVHIYDVAEKTWHRQPARGEIPSIQYPPCITGVSGVENSSFEIFLYGGFKGDPASDTFGGGVRILGLPSFTWLNASVISNRIRYGNVCKVIGGRQMLSFGGQPVDIYVGETGMAPADVWYNGIGIFDMTSLQWKHSYDPDAGAYEPPEMVKALYASKLDSNACGLPNTDLLNSPSTPEWNDSALATIFRGLETQPQDTSTVTSSQPSQTSTSTSTSTSTTRRGSAATATAPGSSQSSVSSHNHTAAIVGGVLGGVIAILATIIIIYFVRRSRRKRQPESFHRPPFTDGLIPHEKGPHELEVKPGELPGHPVHRRQPIEALAELGS